MDFGIARDLNREHGYLQRSHTWLGSVHYLSARAGMGQPVTWAATCIPPESCSTNLNGRLPFNGKLRLIALKHITRTYPAFELSIKVTPALTTYLRALNKI